MRDWWADISDLETWFNAWLRDPVSSRDEVIIRHTIYALAHPNSVEKAVENRKRWDAMGLGKLTA